MKTVMEILLRDRVETQQRVFHTSGLAHHGVDSRRLTLGSYAYTKPVRVPVTSYFTGYSVLGMRLEA